jgi:hypothetical protein
MKVFVVRALTRVCEWVDDVAYRPAVVKLTIHFPRWWSCDLTRLSIHLDERWRAGYWEDRDWEPEGLCQACHRRAAWLVIGGRWDDEPELWDEGEEPGWLDQNPVHVCQWCRPEFGPTDRDDEAAVNRTLAKAGRESIAWRWRRRRPE